MVLQKAPRRAILWGYADVIRDTVTVLKNGVNVGHTTVFRNATGFEGLWKLKLPAEGNPGPYSITVKSSEGEVTINDVMFGDVWICSGQSNMQFTMREVNNSMEEIASSVNYTDVRMFFTKLQPSGVPLHDAMIDTPWIRPVKGIIDRFSALCFMFGRNLYDQYKYPIGLIESNWGGTPIEVWSSPDATAACANNGRKRALWPTSPGVLWNSMIHPFLNMTIYGAIWYQGESNAGNPSLYSCQFPAMISDWRTKFNNGSDSETSSQFPFGFVQLAAFRPGNMVSGFPALRWAQTANVGYVPNPKMPNTFMAVAADLPDFNSPSGSVHPRFKQDIAARLSLAARNIAYGESEVQYQGPFPTRYQLNTGTNQLTVSYANDKDYIQVKSSSGFEVCCTISATSSCSAVSSWKSTFIVGHDNSTVKLDTSVCLSGTHVAGVRYIWKESPCAFKQCAIYSLTSSLPAPPFIHTGGFETTVSSATVSS